MNDSLLAEYLYVLSDIRDYRQYQDRVVKRATLLHFSNLKNFVRDYRAQWSTLKDIDFFYGTNDPAMLRILEQFASASDRQSRWWPILVADLSTDALSIYLRTKNQDTDFSALNKLHQAKGKVLSRNNPVAPIAFVLAAATAIVKTTPKSIIDGMFGIAYSTFEVSIFLWMIALSGFFLIFLAPVWLGANRAKGLYNYAAYMFDYLDLTTSRKKDSITET